MNWLSLHHQRIVLWVLLLVVIGTAIRFDAFANIRHRLTDVLDGPDTTLQNIKIIAIDDVSIQEIGRWPWDRAVFAHLLGNINNARAIGIDVSFLEHSSNDSVLAKQIDSMPQVVLAAELQDNQLLTPVLPGIPGLVNVVSDGDGVTRSVLMDASDSVQPFAVAMYRAGWNANGQLPIGRQQINFAGPPGTFTTISARDIMKDVIDMDRSFVLIGATASDLHDNYFVPSSEGTAMSGVEIHATILQNLLKNSFLRVVPFWVLLLLVACVSAVAIVVVAYRSVVVAAMSVIGFLLTYVVVAIIIARETNVILDLFFVPIAVLLATGGSLGLQYIHEQRSNAELRQAFKKYVSRELLDEIVSHHIELKLGGTRRHITVFFSDIRGFTTLSESLSPEDLVALLNEYLTSMTAIILESHGTVDKFIGDAIMAFWNAPLDQTDHARLACKSALTQVRALERLQHGWKQRNLPVIEIGCGVNTGDAVLGNLGSEERFDYTAIGDTVNLASRLEGLTKEYGVSIIISETTHQELHGAFPTRKLDKVKVKGKNVPIQIYELCTHHDPEFVRHYEHGLAFYWKREFAEAEHAFVAAAKRQPHDKATILFLERVTEFLKHPPSIDWDCSFQHTKK